MTELNEKQLKIRWADIKKLFKERPLLAYRVGVPLEKWDEYMHSTPSAEEINRIYDTIQLDRKNKTQRIKAELSKIVGYREAKDYSRKTGVSDTLIRDILEGKKDKAGYDVINRLELYLHVTLTDFEPSIENPLNLKNYTLDSIVDIVSDINKVADNIKQHSLKLIENTRKKEKETDWTGNEIKPSRFLDFNIERLSELKKQIDLLWETYIDK